MEDLVPLIFFLIIVAVNAIKFFIEKGSKAKPSSGGSEPRPTPVKRPPSLESFFESIAEQMAPKPTELADVPEGFERPDYAQEMEAFTVAQEEDPDEEGFAEIIPFEAPDQAQRPARPPRPTELKKRRTAPTVQRGTRRSTLRIKGRKNLKQAMLAHIVFSPPRALDPSFDPSVSK